LRTVTRTQGEIEKRKKYFRYSLLTKYDFNTIIDKIKTDCKAGDLEKPIHMEIPEENVIFCCFHMMLL
jgi:hypothetical protein